MALLQNLHFGHLPIFMTWPETELLNTFSAIKAGLHHHYYYYYLKLRLRGICVRASVD